VSGGGASLVACAGRESSTEGTSEQGEVGKRGTGSKGARACRGGQGTRRRGRVHGERRGWEVRDGLTGGVCEAERERARAKEKWCRQVGPTKHREGESERRGARVGADRRGLPVKAEGARAGLRLIR
jgi:hypothetical protein